MELEQFQDKINALFTTRVILAETVISELLKTLVATPAYFDIIQLTTNTYPYQKEYEKSVKITKNGSCFQLPVNKMQIVSLVTGLLFQIDRRVLSLVEFLSAYYPKEDVHDSYLAFLKEVILPFREAFLHLAKGNSAEVEEIVTDKPTSPVPVQMQEDVATWLDAIQQLAIGANNLNELERIEVLAVTDGLSQILQSGNQTMFTVMFIGLKNTMWRYRVGSREIKEIERILLKYGLLGG